MRTEADIRGSLLLPKLCTFGPNPVCVRRGTADEADLGCGTHARGCLGGRWFSFLDNTHTATRRFAAPAFDGDTALALDEESEIVTAENMESAEKDPVLGSQEVLDAP
jgi:hypothetical protein